MEYETDEEVLLYDEASNSGSSDGVISESDNEISFDEPEPIIPPSPPNRAFPPFPPLLADPPSPPAPLEPEDLPFLPLTTSSDGTNWYATPPAVNGKFFIFYICKVLRLKVDLDI